MVNRSHRISVRRLAFQVLVRRSLLEISCLVIVAFIDLMLSPNLAASAPLTRRYASGSLDGTVGHSW